jgi:surface antigen
MRRMVTMGLLFALAGCASGRMGSRSGVPGYAGGDMSCVPFARERSGLRISGHAWQWWHAAAGQYERSGAPQPGSVLVFQRTSRNPQGHVAVVSRVISAREIRVDHANWATGRARGQIARDQPVLDVSPRGDWSLVRVWYPPADDFGGTHFPTYGFIHGRRMMASAG